jgi:hypothetical protein
MIAGSLLTRPPVKQPCQPRRYTHDRIFRSILDDCDLLSIAWYGILLFYVGVKGERVRVDDENTFARAAAGERLNRRSEGARHLSRFSDLFVRRPIANGHTF